jgi:CHAT domain-containing protein/tetratricopeptide (TPR) repeat protein
MQHAELATLLIESDNAQREALLRQYSALADVQLAYELKDICQAAWRTDPNRSIQAAAVLEVLTKINKNPEIEALEKWADGIAALTEAQLEVAVQSLDQAETTLLSLGKDQTAAATQLAKIVALAMLGRYEQAIECGIRARDIFLAHDDQMEAGRIENNIGNLYFRRDQYLEAEHFQTVARERFLKINNQAQLAIINNCLANTHALLHKFQSAEQLYEQAISQAENAGLYVTLAEIEGNIGNFTLLQGRYDRALDYLERSRRRYESLRMPHQSAIAEQEIADAYLELNLIPEASAIYDRVIPKFAELQMRAEEARAVTYDARAAVLLDEKQKAHDLLRRATKLYEAEGNEVGAALLKLTAAQLYYSQHDYAAARLAAMEAEPAFATAEAIRRSLFARWLRGEAARCQRLTDEALAFLEKTLADARAKSQPDIEARCLTSLGLLVSGKGETKMAEEFFRSSVRIIEEMRAPLPAEEFRSAFFADKLVPYNELARLCLEGKQPRESEALQFVESARSRALADTLAENLRQQAYLTDQFEVDLLRAIEEQREELNYLYNQLNRRVENQSEGEFLQRSLVEREARLLEKTRQLNHRRQSRGNADALSVPDLQASLGSESALVEYTTVGDELLAFIVTDKSIEVVRNLASDSEVADEVNKFRFQIDTLRYGSSKLRGHLSTLTERARRHLRTLYGLLLREIEPLLGERRLLVVPHRSLHYLPFSALDDGSSYLIERREVAYAPSAVVLQQCLNRQVREQHGALLFGVADEQIPRVREEVLALSDVLTGSKVFLDESATIAALRENAPAAGIVHLACHAQFRSDNPLFSSLRLGDGWLTVRDAYGLKLNCDLVTLSACETGVNAVSPGEELIGLARGFFTAGAPSVMLSLWTVDDDATAELMQHFYREFRRSRSASQALRTAQLRLLHETSHPFFWAPFVVMGRG